LAAEGPEDLAAGPDASPAAPTWRLLTNARWGRTLGLLLLLVGQLRYVSSSARPVLHRWSIPAFAVICGVAFAGAVSLVVSWQRTRATSRRAVGEWIAALDLGYLCLGMAYCIAALDDREAGGRILELDLFGSAFVPSILLGWLALCAFAWGLFVRAWVRWRLVAPRALLVALSLAVVALSGEGVARFVCVAFPQTQGYPTISTDLWVRRFVALNPQGFRDREHEISKPPGVRRIALIGDSFTYGMGIKRTDDRVGDRLERLLDARGIGPVEVINLGIPSAHTLNEIGTLEKALLYHPDLVLLLYVFNDMDYLRSAARPTEIAFAPGSPFERLNPLRILFLNSLLYQQIHIRLRHLYWRFASASQLQNSYAMPDLVERHIDDLRRFATRAREGGAAVEIVPFNPGFALSDGQDPQLAFVQTMLAAGLPVWPVDRIWEGLRFEDLIVNRMDHHPNELANERMAQSLAGLIPALWLPAGSRGGDD